MVLSKKSGRVRSLRVCPVGAVSKTMCWKCEYSGLFKNWTTLLMATASSMPGGKVSSSSPVHKTAIIKLLYMKERSVNDRCFVYAWWQSIQQLAFSQNSNYNTACFMKNKILLQDHGFNYECGKIPSNPPAHQRVFTNLIHMKQFLRRPALLLSWSYIKVRSDYRPNNKPKYSYMIKTCSNLFEK